MKNYAKYIIVILALVALGVFGLLLYRSNNVVIQVDITPEQRAEYEAKVQEYTAKLLQPDPEDQLGRPNMDFFVEKARYEYYLGRLSESINTLKDGLSYYADTTVLLHNMAKTYEAMGRYRTAIDVYKELIAKNNLTVYYIDIARVGRQAGDYNQAKSAYWEYQKIYKQPDQAFEDWLRENAPNP